MREWAIALSVTLVAFIAPVQHIILATGFLLFVDTFTGVWRALYAKQKFSSYRFGRLLAKIVLYNVAIITAHVMGTYLVPHIPMVSLVSTAVAAREGLSIFENISLITGTDLVSLLIEKLHPKRKEEEK